MLTKATNFSRLNTGVLREAQTILGSKTSRSFGAPTVEVMNHLRSLGIRNTNIVHNPS